MLGEGIARRNVLYQFICYYNEYWACFDNNFSEALKRFEHDELANFHVFDLEGIERQLEKSEVIKFTKLLVDKRLVNEAHEFD